MKQIITFTALICIVAQFAFAQQDNDSFVVHQFQKISVANCELSSPTMKYESNGGKFEKMNDALFLFQLEKDDYLNCHFTLPEMAFDVKAYITYKVQKEDVKGRIQWNGTLLPEEQTVFVKGEKTGLAQKEIQLKEFKLENDLRIMSPSSGTLQILNVSVFYQYRLPNNIADIAQQAQTLLNELKYDEALAKIDDALKKDPLNEDYIKQKEIILQAKAPFSIHGKKPGDRVVKTIDGVDFAFRWCPAGTFIMGASASDSLDYFQTQHKVTLTRGFWMMETEVTQAQWKIIMGTSIEEQAQKALLDDTEYEYLRDDYGFSRDTHPEKVLCGKGSNHPMYYVNWDECEEFCRRLSSRLGMQIKLPTEAQWEYACRAGTTTALPNGNVLFFGGNNVPALDSIAWYSGNCSRGFTGETCYNSSEWAETQYPGGPCGVHEVGKKEPNAWGLYDMLGNVGEWCSDFLEPICSSSPKIDPETTKDDLRFGRVIRGGSFDSFPKDCWSASRSKCGNPVIYYDNTGFRIIVVP